MPRSRQTDTSPPHVIMPRLLHGRVLCSSVIQYPDRDWRHQAKSLRFNSFVENSKYFFEYAWLASLTEKITFFVAFPKLPHLIYYLLLKCFHERQVKVPSLVGWMLPWVQFLQLCFRYSTCDSQPPSLPLPIVIKMLSFLKCFPHVSASLWWKTKTNFCLLPSLRF